MNIEHNKQEYPPMHTAEHILNQTMVRMFGCERSRNTHIERKKSKCDYHLTEAPTEQQLREIEAKVNEIIALNLPVEAAILPLGELPAEVNTAKLPKQYQEEIASGNPTSKIRIVTVGDYDICACAGQHVANTSEIGRFFITTTDFNDGVLRVRFKLDE